MAQTGGGVFRAWGPERPVYNRIRYMSSSRKFDSKAYIERIA